MTKDNLLFGIIGLLLGLIIGFVVTNSINRSGYSSQTASTASLATPNSANVPPNRPVVPNNEVKEPPQKAAVPAVQEAIDKAKNEPTNFDAQIKAGEMFGRIQKFDEAATYFEQAVKIKPDDYETIVKLGNSYFDSKNYETAEKWYVKALEIKPNDAAVRTDLGATFVERANPDLDRAIKEFRKSLETDPNQAQGLHNLAVAYKQKGDVQGLSETLEKLEKVNPKDEIIAEFRSGN